MQRRVCARTKCPKPFLMCASCVRHSLAGVVVVCASRVIVRCMYRCFVPTACCLQTRGTTSRSCRHPPATQGSGARRRMPCPHSPGDARIRWPVHAYFLHAHRLHARRVSTLRRFHYNKRRQHNGSLRAWLGRLLGRRSLLASLLRLSTVYVLFSGSVTLHPALWLCVTAPCLCLCQRRCHRCVSPSPALCLCLRPCVTAVVQPCGRQNGESCSVAL